VTAFFHKRALFKAKSPNVYHFLDSTPVQVVSSESDTFMPI
jgi:hypothetical protein